MSEILLTHSNHLYSDPKQVRKMQPWPPLQTILAAAVLRKDGYRAGLYDPCLEDHPLRGYERAIAGERPRMIVVCEDDFNFLTKMCLGNNRALAFRMATKAREANIPIIAHGSDATDNAGEYLRAGFDRVIAGEVEESLQLLAGGAELSSIPGLVYLDTRGDIRQNARPNPVKDLDGLPMPAWELVDIEAYRRAWMAHHGYFALNMATSRGCPFRCNWCAKPIHGSNYRVRSAAGVARELAFLKASYRPDKIWFADDIFALPNRWAVDFAEAVNEQDAAIPFRMQSRCDLMTRDTVRSLRAAGAEEVWMGAESGSQRILDAMEKDIQVGEIYAARENLRSHDVRACFFLQFGYPGETWEDIEATVEMVRRAAPDDIGVSVSYPLPGTRFHQIVGEQLKAKKNWTDSSDLAMMFGGTWSTEFYRALSDALHAEVRGEVSESAVAEMWDRVTQLREEVAVAV